jgi:hypothetical protein
VQVSVTLRKPERPLFDSVPTHYMPDSTVLTATAERDPDANV